MMQRNLVDLLHNRFKRNISIRSLNISPMAQRLRSGSRWCSKASDNCLSHHRRKRDINVVEAVWFINPPSIAWGLEPGFPMTTCDTLDKLPSLWHNRFYLQKRYTDLAHYSATCTIMTQGSPHRAACQASARYNSVPRQGRDRNRDKDTHNACTIGMSKWKLGH